MARRLNSWGKKNKITRESQAGFRGARGTRDHIFVLNSIINNKVRKKGERLYVAFVDFKKAFDRGDRGKMFKKMEKKKMGGKFLRWTRILLKDTWNEVIAGNGITEEFQTWRGVKQGCPLNPSLFCIFLDDLD